MPWTLPCLVLTLVASGAQPAAPPVKPQDLTLEQLYRVKPFAGRIARGMAFSADARYLAYLWNPYGEQGSDLYVHDVQSGQTRRLTSLDIMKAFERPEILERFQKKAEQRDKQQAEAQAKAEAQAAYLAGAKVDLEQWEKAALEQLKKEVAEKKAKEDAQKKDERADKKADAKTDTKPEKEKELWEWRDELKKKQEKDRVKGGDLYPGVSQVAWAHKANELLFGYRGDLFRCQVETGRIERLTSTDRGEGLVGFTAGDEGYLLQDGQSLVKVDFARGRQVQLNRALFNPDDAEKKYGIRETALSEDGQWVSLMAEVLVNGALAPRYSDSFHIQRVQLMDYTKRFAEARTVDREEASDNKRAIPAQALYICKVSDAPSPQPVPVWTHPGGDVWIEQTPVVWAKDGRHYSFVTWEREKGLLKVYLGAASETEKPTVVVERKERVGHEIVNVMTPRFSPDGKTLFVILDDAGYRQPYALDLATKALRPVLKGDFEAHTLLGFTPDSRTLYLLSNKLDPATETTFGVDVATGAMKPLGPLGEVQRGGVVAETGGRLAFTSGSWAHRPELQVLEAATNQAKVLTDSHDKAWDALNVIQPERFSYTNRTGDTIRAFMFKPKGWKPSDKRPAVVYTYGGPTGESHTVMADSFQRTAYVFGMYMAAKHGYVMVAVDPRGESNYGKKFSDANWNQPGKPQAEDLEDLVKTLGQRYGVDEKRVGLTGWSFGGYQTQYTMYTKPDLFACGIAGAGPTEWENYNSWYVGRTITGLERGKPVARKFSLLPLAKGLKHPLLLAHGMADDNVLFQDTVNVYRALLESGKEALVDLFVDPEGGHGMGGAVNSKIQHKKFEAFFLRHLGKGK